MQRILTNAKYAAKHGRETPELRYTAEVLDASGPAVLFIHGFPDTYRSFRAQAAALNAAGFRTVAPMLRGYEPSSQHPTNDYHARHLAEDVRVWLDELEIEKAHLVGHDWGAIVAYAAASRFPERVGSLSLLAVPGILEYLKCLARYPSQFRRSWYMFLFQLPYIARRALARDELALIDRLWGEWSPDWNDPERGDRLAEIKNAFRRPGVIEAAIAYYRSIFDCLTPTGFQSFRTLLGKIHAPTLAITGENDGCLDTRMFDFMADGGNYAGGLRVQRLENAGHWLHLERPEAVNRLLLEFLRDRN
ncbi:MAG: alpha/beta hydrolase [Leptospirales bacterium]|jgi:pimeloyl-ACP methyl ester carboxylesterase